MSKEYSLGGRASKYKINHSDVNGKTLIDYFPFLDFRFDLIP